MANNTANTSATQQPIYTLTNQQTKPRKHPTNHQTTQTNAYTKLAIILQNSHHLNQQLPNQPTNQRGMVEQTIFAWFLTMDVIHIYLNWLG